MRVTIVPEDRFIQVDGRGLNLDFPSDPSIHAIQWYSDHGTIEQKMGGSRSANLADVAPFVALWEEARSIADAPPTPAEIDAAAAIAAAVAAKAEAVAENKGHATIQYLTTHTPAQIADYIGSNVTDLVSAKVVITRLAVAIGALLR